MNTSALLAFIVVLAVFGLITMYVFSRLRAIRVENDVAKLAMSIYLVAATAVTVVTLLVLVRP